MSHRLKGLIKVDENPDNEDRKDKGKGKSKKDSSKSVDKVNDDKKDNKSVETRVIKVNEGASCSSKEVINKSENELMRADIDRIEQSMNSQSQNITSMIKDLQEAFRASQSSQSSVSKPNIESSDDEDMTFSDIEEGEINDDNLEQFIKISGLTVEEGPKLNEKLSKGLDEMLSKGIQEESKGELMKKYKTPTNCKRLEVVQCNTEIYKKASKNTRITEAKLVEIQQCMNKGICALTISFNESLSSLNGSETISAQKFKELNNINTDALALLTQATHMMDIFRKLNFRKEVKREYSSICKEEEIRENLFGNDLAEKVKVITETNKLTNMMSQRKRKYPFLDKNQQGQLNRQSFQKQNYQNRSQSYPKRDNQKNKTNFKKWAYKKGDQKNSQKRRKD